MKRVGERLDVADPVPPRAHAAVEEDDVGPAAAPVHGHRRGAIGGRGHANARPDALGEERHLRVELAAVGGEELEDEVLDAAVGELRDLVDQRPPARRRATRPACADGGAVSPARRTRTSLRSVRAGVAARPLLPAQARQLGASGAELRPAGD